MQAESSESFGKKFIAGHSGSLLFLIMAALLFAVIYLCYEKFFVGSVPFYRYLELYGALASKLLSLMNIPHEFLALVEEIEGVDFEKVIRNTLKNDDLGVKVIVNEGTDAGVIFAALLAAVLAWPGNLFKKLGAALASMLMIFGLNVLRIAGMYLVDIHAPLQFALYRNTVLPIALAIAALLCFLAWTKLSGRHPDD